MATTLSSPVGVQGAETDILPLHKGQTPVFEVEFSSGAIREFWSQGELREAILHGEVPRTALIRKVGESGAAAAESITVEKWAQSNSEFKALYAPVWALTMKGALIGFLAVGVLKVLDTLIGIGAVNPAAAVVWLLLGAGLASPKWKLQLMGAALFISFKAGISFSLLMGAWFGVFAFAAVFGISGGMAVGTLIGYLKGRRLPKAPDCTNEGRKPLILGLAIPLAVLTGAVVTYIKIFIPAMLQLASNQ